MCMTQQGNDLRAYSVFFVSLVAWLAHVRWGGGETGKKKNMRGKKTLGASHLPVSSRGPHHRHLVTLFFSFPLCCFFFAVISYDSGSLFFFSFSLAFIFSYPSIFYGTKK